MVGGVGGGMQVGFDDAIDGTGVWGEWGVESACLT